jgi:hypothetical protein
VVAGAHLRRGAPLPRTGLHQWRAVAQIVDDDTVTYLKRIFHSPIHSDCFVSSLHCR